MHWKTFISNWPFTKKALVIFAIYWAMTWTCMCAQLTNEPISSLVLFSNCDRIWKKPGFHTHNIKLMISPKMDYWLNTLSYSTVCLASKSRTSLVSVAAFLRPCVSLGWHFGIIRWSWLSCICAWRAGQATKGWPMSVIFNLECCEHKEGPVGHQTGPLAFNCLRIPFCTLY